MSQPTLTLSLLQEPENLEACLKEIPTESGVYFMRDRQGDILYIGKSKKLRSRIRSYFRDSPSLSSRIALMVQQVAEIEFIVTDTEAEALALEANLIKQHQPYFNVLLKDDKKYPYVCITWSEAYPRIFITRKRRVNNGKDRYYGPYVDTHLLRQTLHFIQRTFPLRQRPQPLFKERPCLNYDLGRCPGVCQQLISPEDYHKIVQKVAMIFQGRTGELIELLNSQMEKAAETLNFERAAIIRDQLQALTALNANQKVALSDDTISRDAIALAKDDQHCCIQLFQIRAGRLVGRLGFFAEAQSGTSGEILQRVLEEHYWGVDGVEIPKEILVQSELPEGDILSNWLREKKGKKVTLIVPQRQTKAELIELVERNASYELERTQRFAARNFQALEDLAEILDLPTLPKRIEGYDISHIQGSNAVASQVVFINGIPAKQQYRHYNIKNPQITIGHSDDFASLSEVIRRRFRQYSSLENLLQNPEFGIRNSEFGSQPTPNPTHPHLPTPNPTHPRLPTPNPTHPRPSQEGSQEGNRSQEGSQEGNRSQEGKEGIQNPEDLPDLIMIDGGKGQLSAVVKVLQEINLLPYLRVVSLAKQREEIFLPGESQPLPTDAEQPGVQLLRRVRDEAHRFAVGFHRQKRLKNSRRSQLEEISGLGFQRQKQLLAHFHSIDYIREASLEQLREVEGIGLRLAEEIYHYFHPG